MTIVNVGQMSKILRRKPPAICKAARRGKFGPYARQDSRGRWLFESPAAEREFRRNTDTTRMRVEHLATLTPEPETADPETAEVEADYRASRERLVDACRDLPDEDRQLLDEALREHEVSLECPRWDLHFATPPAELEQSTNKSNNTGDRP